MEEKSAKNKQVIWFEQGGGITAEERLHGIGTYQEETKRGILQNGMCVQLPGMDHTKNATLRAYCKTQGRQSPKLVV